MRSNKRSRKDTAIRPTTKAFGETYLVVKPLCRYVTKRKPTTETISVRRTVLVYGRVLPAMTMTFI